MPQAQRANISVKETGFCWGNYKFISLCNQIKIISIDLLTLSLRLYRDTLTPSTDISNDTFFFFIPLDLNSYYFEMNEKRMN